MLQIDLLRKRLLRQIGRNPLNSHVADFFRTGQCECAAIWQHKHEVALFIQIKDTAMHLPAFGPAADLSASKPAALTHFSDGCGEIIFDACELGIQSIQQAVCQSVFPVARSSAAWK